MKYHLPCILVMATMPAGAQIVDPGFENGGAWQFSCAPAYSFDVPEYGGSTSASLVMLSATQPDCYHVDGIEPFVFQELPWLQNGDAVTVSFSCKSVPDMPGDEPFMEGIVSLGWMVPPYDYQVNWGAWSSNAGGPLPSYWDQYSVSFTFSGMPPGAVPMLALRGVAYNNTNGTALFDNVLLSVEGVGAQLNAKAWLDGCYVQASGLMRDDLRTQGHVPLVDPYDGTTTIDPAVLTTTGNDAIVDWVRIELRLGTSALSPSYARNALIQCDGDIVEVDGASTVTFPVQRGNFHVVLLHRNHLGVISALPMALTGSPTTIDFRSPATFCLVLSPPYTGPPRKSVGAARTLWAGDATGDHRIKYTGADNDRDPLLAAIGGSVPTATISGYLDTDVNMDGFVKYTGSNNDRDLILLSIGGSVPTAVRVGQVP